MKSAIVLMFALLGTQNVNAGAFDKITCQFVEPEVTTVYTMADQTFVAQTMDREPIMQTGVIWKRVGDGQYVLENSNGEVIQRMKLTYEGSDGQTSEIFPLEVKWFELTDAANKGLGGCKTNYFRSIIENAGQH